jgi:DNA-binding CsgD family transcriptional regulator
MLAGRMRVSSTTSSPPDSGADTLVVGVFDGETVAHDVEGGALQRLIDSGEARTAYRHVSVGHAAGRRWLLVGLGPRSAFDAERARVAAAVALLDERQRELVALRYGADLTAKQIAGFLGVNTNAVEVALHRALARLRTIMSADAAVPAERAASAVRDRLSQPT